MCRMIGFAAFEPVDAAPFLAALSTFSRSGNLVEGWERRPGGNHPDGWGIAYREAGEMKLLRGGMPANADPMFSEVRVATDRFIGHVRYASNTATVNAGNATRSSFRGRPSPTTGPSAGESARRPPGAA